MFKEYDKNTYKEKEVKDRTPFRTAFKKVWNDVNVWRVLLFMFIALIWLLGSSLKTNAAESNVYVDETYLQEQFGTYKQYAIVTDGNGNYATIYTNGKMISNGLIIYSLMSYDDFGFKTMKLENDYLVIDDTSESYNGRTSVTISFNTGGYGLSSNMKQIIYANTDIYNIKYSNTGSPSASDEVFYSVANNIGAKPADDSGTVSPDINIDIDLTEVLSYLDELNIKTDDILIYLSEISLALKSIFTMLSICVFFLIADWTSNKIKNITRRFSNYE